MKRIICFLALFSLLISASAQDSTKLTVKQVYEDAKQGITKVVNALGGPAKHVYKVYTQQHMIEGIASGLATLFGLVFFLVIALRLYRKADFGSDNAQSIKQCVFFVFSCIGSLVMIIATVCYLQGDFMKILNPEYYAIQDIIKAFK